MVENSAQRTNEKRVETCAAMTAVSSSIALPFLAEAAAISLPVEAAPPPPTAPPADDFLVNVFVHTTNGRAIEKAAEVAIGEPVRRGSICTMTIPLSKLEVIAAASNVTHLEMAEPLAAPNPTESDVLGPPDPAQRVFGDPASHRFGAPAQGTKGVLIGIIDVGGFDFAHPDFLDKSGRTRWIRIWDQGAKEGTPPGRIGDATFSIGHEFKKEDLDHAIEQSKKLKVPPWMLERQSQTTPGSHGTHVASIAAGNSGICRQAAIAGVLVTLTDDEIRDRRGSFYDSTRLAHAIEYLVELAKQQNLSLSINISLGTNGHAHDASSAINRWIDNAMTTPGRVVCVAAGNAGQESASAPDDLGWLFGCIHSSGQIASKGLYNDLEWIVVGDKIRDVSENEMEIWYSAQDKFRVWLRPPGGNWIGPVEAGKCIEHKLVGDTEISIYNERYHPANGANYIAVYLTPRAVGEPGGITPGQWTVRIEGTDVRDGRYHAWIERDAIRRINDFGRYSYPSCFSKRSNVDNSSVGSLACGMRVLSVANLDFAREQINKTSSQGPTRDGRFKPDVAAPGTDIVAANGFAGSDHLWIAKSGTSMASPFMCGVAGLMLAITDDLTAAQIEGIVHGTSVPLPGASYSWLNDAGFGKLVPERCLEEAASINKREPMP